MLAKLPKIKFNTNAHLEKYNSLASENEVISFS